MSGELPESLTRNLWRHKAYAVDRSVVERLRSAVREWITWHDLSPLLTFLEAADAHFTTGLAAEARRWTEIQPGGLHELLDAGMNVCVAGHDDIGVGPLHGALDSPSGRVLTPPQPLVPADWPVHTDTLELGVYQVTGPAGFDKTGPVFRAAGAGLARFLERLERADLVLDAEYCAGVSEAQLQLVEARLAEEIDRFEKQARSAYELRQALLTWDTRPA